MPGRKLLILDLDETLIHATEEPLEREADFRVAYWHVYRRPHLEAFLAAVAERFEVAVWSSASPLYVAAIVARLWGPEPDLAFVCGSDRCTQRFCPESHDYYWRKPMRKVRRQGYALEQVIVVDDTPRKWEQSYGNLVRVRPFTGPPDDELLLLARYLEILDREPNVRRVEKRGWRILMRNQQGMS